MSWRRIVWKKVSSPAGQVSGDKGDDDKEKEGRLDIYKWQYIALMLFKIQPSEFWNMPVDDFCALLYNYENKGIDPMTMEDFEELKSRLG